MLDVSRRWGKRGIDDLELGGMNRELALKPDFLGGQGIVFEPFRVAEQEVGGIQGEHVRSPCGDTHNTAWYGHLRVICSTFQAHIMRQIFSAKGRPDNARRR